MAKTPKESEIAPQVKQALQACGCQVFRNSVGRTRFGQHWVSFGLGGVGGSDYIGYLPVRITPKMVNKVLPVFVAVEAKRPKGAKYPPEQIKFLQSVAAAGGIAGFARSWELARALVMDWFSKFE